MSLSKCCSSRPSSRAMMCPGGSRLDSGCVLARPTTAGSNTALQFCETQPGWLKGREGRHILSNQVELPREDPILLIEQKHTKQILMSRSRRTFGDEQIVRREAGLGKSETQHTLSWSTIKGQSTGAWRIWPNTCCKMYYRGPQAVPQEVVLAAGDEGGCGGSQARGKRNRSGSDARPPAGPAELGCKITSPPDSIESSSSRH